jgi:Na+/melibiose symporter-like transporter
MGFDRGRSADLSEKKVGFFNSLSIRLTLAVLGGALYAILTYALVRSLNLSSPLSILAALIVYVLYLSSRFLLLFSGIDSPYYRREREEPSKTLPEKNSFQEAAQWVGTFYHRHDIALFVLLGLLSLVFLVSIVRDGFEGNPLGKTIQTLWNTLWPVP